jgi:hypothetical protein
MFHRIVITQVLHFSSKLVELLPDYEIASEHEHSNCLLLALKKVRLFHLFCQAEFVNIRSRHGSFPNP